MIADNETNTVYFSDLLRTDPRFSDTCIRIIKILDSLKISYKFLPKTKDIWARDYMPIQVAEDKFIEYRYDPDYLQGIEKGTRDIKTYPDIVCNLINIKTTKTDIILDGGNIVKSKDHIILTDKIVKENRFQYNKTELTKQLEELFEVNHVILIPWYTGEIFGHSDGMLRFIDEETVLINKIEKSESLEESLKKHGLNWEYLEYKVKSKGKYNWAYINFLQMKDCILLPEFDADEDDQAYELIKNYYTDYSRNNSIIQVKMNEIVKFGGAFNCISWNIKQPEGTTHFSSMANLGNKDAI